MEKYWLGIDIGSVSVKAAILDHSCQILMDYYLRHKGQPIPTLLDLLKKINNEINLEQIVGISATGSGGKLIANLLNISYTNEIIAQAKANTMLYPYIRTVIEIGGEDSKLIILGTDLEDFSMNTLCAAGTGSFLDQQAVRLNVTIEEFSQIALNSRNPARLAGRCSVFAKTDMIHLQQRATPTEDIIAGLCYALARNFKGNIAKGRAFQCPIVFEGGVASNRGMVKAFENILGLNTGELIVPPHFATLGAIGSAIISIQKKQAPEQRFRKIEEIEKCLLQFELPNLTALEPLLNNNYSSNQVSPYISNHPTDYLIDAYLGVDVGSISTNLAVIDKNKNLITKRYLMTAGRPIEAVKTGLKEIGNEIGDKVKICGVCTTGSARYLISDFIGADIVKNEITAQATAALEIDPDVDTIFEIGGQDSKYISLNNGTIVDFEMNKVCAAGTGSFLEEQAEKLNLKIEEEFSQSSFASKKPIRLGERCTVFMESDLTHYQGNGASCSDLVAGLSYSITENYLNRVVGKKKIGDKIFFQGGVAFNKAVCSAFEKILNKKITIPPHHEVTGAIGCALIALGHTKGKSGFKGFSLSDKKYEISSFECTNCTNRCEINSVNIEGEKPFFYGSRCEKYEHTGDMQKSSEPRPFTKERGELPDLFAEYEKLLLSSHTNLTAKGSIKIGFPRSLPFFYELFPFWHTVFTELGLQVVLSDLTNKKIVHDGLENINVEPCFPIKVIHGHILNLIDKKVDYIFIPSIITLNNHYCCPYVQTIPYTIESTFNLKEKGVNVLQPIIYFKYDERYLQKVLIKLLHKKFCVPENAIKKAVNKGLRAQINFSNTIKQRGKEILQDIRDKNEKAIVIVSRPYNSCDRYINLNLPKKLRGLNIQAIPLDYLPLGEIDIDSEYPNMYWAYGRKILQAGKFIKDNDNLYALYLTNFGCGPDSFIINYFNKLMEGKPYLQIEIDAHSADAGIVTRCEAFLDSLQQKYKKHQIAKIYNRVSIKNSTNNIINSTFYIPYMCDHAHIISASLGACGLDAKVMPEPDSETLYWGRKYTLGKECFPCIITTGDMIKLLKKETNSKNISFFMPSGNGPCRFGQYNVFQRMILDSAGYRDVAIYSFNQEGNIYNELGPVGGNKFVRYAWQGIVIVDLLEKLVRQIRPYEIEHGKADQLYKKYLFGTCQAITNEENLFRLVHEIKSEFRNIKVNTDNKKPIIGIVGEIFIRNQPFSNNCLINKLEKLGAQVWMPPCSEWVLYESYLFKQKKLKIKNLFDWPTYYLKKRIQHYDEHRIKKPFKDLLENLEEPTIKEILNLSRPYLDPSFEGEAVLSVGKGIDFARKGLSGIIMVMPFTCMPGTIANAIFKKVQRDYNLPFLSIVYDGIEMDSTQTRLEAFIHQVA